MIALVVMMLGVGTWAVFNDTESAGPFTATAGSLDLEVDTTQVVPGEIGDLKPSEWHYLGPFRLHNAGSNPGVLDLHFANVVDGPGTQTEPECAATWGYLENGDCLGDWYVPVDDISNWIDVDYVILGPEVYTCPTSGGTVIGKLGDIESQVIDLNREIAANENVYICLSFHLEKDAGNEYQGDVASFDIEFTLHQVGQPAGRETVRLENKDPSTWRVIGDDDIWGSVTYEVNAEGNLEMQVRVNGLAADTWHQLALNGPDGTGTCEAVDDQLASGSEKAGHAGYDSGFWDGVGPNINQGLCEPGNNEGIYNFAYVQTNAQGDWSGTIIVTNSGETDPPNANKVSAANPALPVGIYSDVKFIVKEVTGALPGTAWTPVMMEMQTLNFNLP
jgi:predicted ribosomally synthesized peptide with SipW-like signal peptide